MIATDPKILQPVRLTRVAALAALEIEERAPRILVAEDDDQMRALITQVLEAEGYEVVERADGLSALEDFAYL
ncbi:MAG: hypothetical protein ABIL09_20510, partial [Gemmatimonadota bacterium]